MNYKETNVPVHNNQLGLFSISPGCSGGSQHQRESVQVHSTPGAPSSVLPLGPPYAPVMRYSPHLSGLLGFVSPPLSLLPANTPNIC